MPFHNTNRNGTISKCHRHIGLSATTSTESNNSTWNRLIVVFFSLSSIYTALAADNYKYGKHVPTIFTFVNLHISQCRLRATINNSSVVWCTDAVFPAINGDVSLVTLWIKKTDSIHFEKYGDGTRLLNVEQNSIVASVTNSRWNDTVECFTYVRGSASRHYSCNCVRCHGPFCYIKREQAKKHRVSGYSYQGCAANVRGLPCTTYRDISKSGGATRINKVSVETGTGRAVQ